MTTIEFDYNLNSMRLHLTRFAYQLTLNAENAADLVQETYLKALSNRDKYKEDINFKAWTFTIMRNLFINQYRKKQKYQCVDQEPDHYSLQGKHTSHDTPDGQMTISQLNAAIDKLDYDYKQPLLLHIRGFKYCEIAQQLNLKMGTVKSRIFLSRKKLNHILSDRNLQSFIN